jgi:hypothetical protein
MKRWAIVCVKAGEEAKYLELGWEPFAVSPHNTSYMFNGTQTYYQSTDYIYLRFLFAKGA